MNLLYAAVDIAVTCFFTHGCIHALATNTTPASTLEHRNRTRIFWLDVFMAAGNGNGNGNAISARTRAHIPLCHPVQHGDDAQDSKEIP
jgi:hypothetical protein